MFLCYTSQGVVTTVKWSISLVVTSNHECLNKIVSNKLALIIFEPRTQPQRWYSYDHIIQKIVQCILYRDLPNDILDCTVQMCDFPTLDVVQWISLFQGRCG